MNSGTSLIYFSVSFVHSSVLYLIPKSSGGGVGGGGEGAKFKFLNKDAD
jgi:hypothetical protein